MVAGATLVRTTTRASLVVQAITGVVGAIGLIAPFSPENKLLNQVLTLEMIVQGVEFLFYTFFVTLLNLELLTGLRYADWFLSTPTMLFTMASYFIFQSEQKSDEPLTIEAIWTTYKREIMIMLVANFFMLLLGLLGEVGILSRPVAFWTGTAAFAVSFYTLYDKFASKSLQSTALFAPIAAIWGAYGLAFLQGPVTKNIAYNFLDILAKNFFGLFLAYQLWAKAPN
jgi:hypothetical protein